MQRQHILVFHLALLFETKFLLKDFLLNSAVHIFQTTDF